MGQFAAFYVGLITETSAKSTHAASVSIFKLTTYCSYFFGGKNVVILTYYLTLFTSFYRNVVWQTFYLILFQKMRLLL